MGKGQRILVVDDEQRFRQRLSEILESSGYDVTMAATGAEALALFKQKPFPLIFTDIQMPDMCGIELLAAVKSLHHNCEVIVTNSYAYLSRAIAAMRAGAYDCLIKPFKDDEVICNSAHQAMEKLRLQNQNHNLIEALKQHNKALEAANSRLRKLATHDGLTGLFNHRHLQQCLAAEINRAHRYPETFSILFIDMDDFKVYNDSNGHMAGDALLKQLSSLFVHCFRKTDIIARYGGDEFVVILPETGGRDAEQIADKLRRQVRNHDFDKCDAMPNGCITVSVGTATYPDNGTSADALLNHADRALYRDKGHKYIACT